MSTIEKINAHSEAIIAKSKKGEALTLDEIKILGIYADMMRQPRRLFSKARKARVKKQRI